MPSTSQVERRSAPRGVTLIETLIAITIAALAGSAMLLAMESALSTATDATDRAIADGLAQQLVDEVAQKRFVAVGMAANDSGLGPNSSELAQPGRSGFNDTDDFTGYTASPPQSVYGQTLGTEDGVGGLRFANFRLPSNYLNNWRHRISVYFVDPTTLQKLNSGTSYYRCIEATVDQKDATGAFIPLSTKRRIIAYVPPTTS